MRWWIGSVLLLSACFKVGGVDLSDLGPLDDGGRPVRLSKPAHLPAHYLTDGMCDLVISGQQTLNADSGQLDNASLPQGCRFRADEPQTGSGGQFFVGVLAVRTLTIPQGASLYLTGARPLAIVATNQIQIAGLLDGSANLATPGPGGLVARGVGGNGGSNGSGDSGGAGGSGGSIGGAGGNGPLTSPVSGGAPGSINNDFMLSGAVEGGSRGGAGGRADVGCGQGGGGGGAIQLSAGSRLTLSGQILVNGGGGLGGCYIRPEAGGGGGGGSGGAQYLESPLIDIAGAVLTANGGGGGSGGDDGSNGQRGNDGQNGQSTDTTATGGARIGSGEAGGNGAAGSANAITGNIGLDAGGGGGGLGLIVFSAAANPTGANIVSPGAAFVQLTF